MVLIPMIIGVIYHGVVIATMITVSFVIKKCV